MGMLMPLILHLAKLCIIGFALLVQGYLGHNASPSPAEFSSFPPIERIHGEQRSFTPSTPPQPNERDLLSPPALPPLLSAPVPEMTEGHARSLPPTPHDTAPPPFTIEERVPSLAPSTPLVLPLSSPPQPVQVHAPSKSPIAPQGKEPVSKSLDLVPDAPAPVAFPTLPRISPNIDPFPSITPSQNSPKNPPVHQIPSVPPSHSSPENSPFVHQTPIAPQFRNSPQNSPSINSSSSSAFPPTDNQRNSSNNKRPVLEPSAPAPVAPGLRDSPQSSPPVHSSMPRALAPTPSANQENSSNSKAPVKEPIAPAPVTTPWRNSPHFQGPTSLPPRAPILVPPTPVSVASPPRKVEMTPPPVRSIVPPSISPISVVSPPGESPHSSPTVDRNVTGNPSPLPDPNSSPVSNPPSSNDGTPVKSPTNETHKSAPPVNHAPKNGSDDTFAGSSPAISPPEPTAKRLPSNSLVPSLAPANEAHNSPALSPSTSFHEHQHKRNERTSPAPASSDPISPPLKQQGPVISPAFHPRRKQRHYAPPPFHSAPPSLSSVPSPVTAVSPVPSPSPVTASRQTKMPRISPKVSPSVSPSRSPKVAPPPARVMSFPPPPPNQDCSTTICTDPYTNTPPGSPCGCVLPMQVGLRLSVALYTFFPLVSELAEEIAVGVFMKQSQVRIMGANAASEQPEKTIVLVDLVPLGEKFDNTTAFLTYQRFWHKQVAIKASLFGDYEVLYVRYLGLPPSPPLPPDAGIIDGEPYSGNNNNARAIKPLGVDVHGKRRKHALSGGVITIIVMSVLVVVVLCSAVAWVLLFKHGDQASQRGTSPQHPQTSHAKPSGSAGSMFGSGLSSISLSFGSSIAGYTGSAKTLTASEIERATGNFDDSRILGEGGFGRVYRGVLEDGTNVAVKVLKRDDQQGGREFLAEVEMLSRLHHRNLVKLIGICTEERSRCLVYELIPNGSVESHLHGVDKESAPLDWDARIKIALGAARGLAYLHEDSSPRVIHRDFKSSNILLEHDFTPKVSDFGLARTAMDEEGRHISTRVMGTFGYVAPEYAMTGHLLVKSDVYSYGVVLLELLTGRKPVDMTQPPGQENLVAWARPLLASKEGLETIIDPSLGSDVSFESVAKVAAIASMCVQPEVSHRPFMGEVVQALKLVCNECDEAKVGSRGTSQDDISIDMDGKVGTGSEQLSNPLQSHYSIPNYVSGLDTERGLSVSDLFSSSARFRRESSESFRRHCTSGPLRTGRGNRFWHKMQQLSRGSISEHGAMIKFWSGSH
ncbi:hypothetical protein ES319_D07G011300v1 [Gossypium barbadense]|uniref:Protein kinase domain-containing protein n=1 Tax=Gossypium barbadense TaxID=3634 RepID=A0A5J5QMK4_GOSBA|nr:hypothetical protein ES319_D07G011300v1 [Gossypium barbadense]PPD98005.1 hypothetical protein GOBAR_DD04944 [Gossypium barbadense]